LGWERQHHKVGKITSVGRPGGLLSATVYVVDEFLESGDILSEVDANGQRQTWSARSGGVATKIPIVILQDQSSASGAEVLAAALRDNDRAKIVGTRSFGKGTVNQLQELKNCPEPNQCGAVYISVGRWLTPNGEEIEGVGVKPDIELEMTADEYIEQGDIQLFKAIEILREARNRDILAGIGHSNATYAEAQEAIAAGATHGIHLFNAMRPLSHRDPGIVAAVLASDAIYAELIADGVHLDPVVVSLAAHLKSFDRLLLITDATSATGMPDGTYQLGTMKVQVKDGVSRDSEGRLAGSTLTQDVAVRNVMSWTGCSMTQALRAATLNPATLLRCDGRKGMLREGADADLVILDGACRVVHTLVGGQTVFSAL